jgi:hypothetical protein
MIITRKTNSTKLYTVCKIEVSLMTVITYWTGIVKKITVGNIIKKQEPLHANGNKSTQLTTRRKQASAQTDIINITHRQTINHSYLIIQSSEVDPLVVS